MPTANDIRALNRSVIEEFRATNGKVTHPRLKDVQLVLLTTTGARTGRPHTTPLAFFSDGPGRIVLWASAMAAASHPAWYRNLAANPRVTAELGMEAGAVRRFDGTAQTATGAERDRLFGVLTASRPEIAAHQDRTARQIPLVIVQYQE
jgi:deazaflavin-dependent oxidoreductase (nitroreductase family)